MIYAALLVYRSIFCLVGHGEAPCRLPMEFAIQKIVLALSCAEFSLAPKLKLTGFYMIWAGSFQKHMNALLRRYLSRNGVICSALITVG